jgi:hypothetical protein
MKRLLANVADMYSEIILPIIIIVKSCTNEVNMMEGGRIIITIPYADALPIRLRAQSRHSPSEPLHRHYLQGLSPDSDTT